MPSEAKPAGTPSESDHATMAERVGLHRALALFPADVAAACANAERSRASLRRDLPPDLEPCQKPLEEPR